MRGRLSPRGYEHIDEANHDIGLLIPLKLLILAEIKFNLSISQIEFNNLPWLLSYDCKLLELRGGL